MKRKVLGFFLLLAILEDCVHASEDAIKISESILNSDECKNVQLEELQNVINEMEAADQVEMRNHSLVLFLTADYQKTIKLVDYLTKGKRIKPNLNKLSNNEALNYSKISEMIDENFFEYKLNDTNVVYYVYPGEENLNHELFAKYLAKKAIDHATEIKFVLTYVHPATNHTEDELVKLDSKESIDATFTYCTDRMRNLIKDLMQSTSKIVYDPSYYNGSIGLIQFKASDKCACERFADGWNQGIIIELVRHNITTDLLNQRIRDGHVILTILNYTDSERNRTINEINKLKFVEVNENTHLFFQRSARLSNLIKCAEFSLNNLLASETMLLVKTIHTYYLDLEEKFKDLSYFTRQLNEGYTILSDTILEMSKIHDIRTVFEKLNTALKTLKIKIPGGLLSRLSRSFNHLIFLESERVERIKSKELMQNFLGSLSKIIKNHIKKSASWYTKLNSLYQESVLYLSNNITEIMEPKLENCNMEIDSELDNQKLKRKAIDDAKAYILQRKIKKECIFVEENKIYKLKIHGDVINFSDIPDVEICEGKTRFIELFARDTIIIDKDLIKVEEAVQVVAIAPKMRVVGNRTINLNGAPGKAHDPPSANSSELGLPGTDGLPGLPGGPGGKFIGVSEIIENENLLKIFANGGEGGPGQNGGNGKRGINGLTPHHGEILDFDSPRIQFNPRTRFILELMFSTKTRKNTEVVSCIVSGTHGTDGTDGGNGGIGGKGGKAGYIFLHQLKKKSEANKWKTNNGQSGLNGKGGEGGTRGATGIVVVALCEVYFTQVEVLLEHENFSSEPNSYVAYEGKDGRDGAISEGRKEPIDYEGFRDYAFVLNDYKKYIRSYWRKPNKNKKLITFYRKLINNEEINREYGTLGLLDELKGLEEQYLDLRDSIDLAPMYENLRKRIEEYLGRRWTNEADKEYEVTLGFAYTAALSKATRLRAISDGNCVVNLKEYLSLVFKNLNELEESIVQFTNEKISENYKNNINQKISEAQSLIDEQLKNEIPKINQLMRHNVVNLIHETSNLQEDLKKREEALKKAMQQQSILTILKSAVVAVGVLLPGGQVAATVALTAIEVGSNYITQIPKDKIKVPIAIGKNITIARKILIESRNSSAETLNNQLNYLLEMKAKLQNSSNQTTQIDRNITFTKEEMKNVKQEIINLIKEEKEKKVDEKTSINLFSIISKVKIFSKLNYTDYTDSDLNDLVDVAKDYKENIEKLENNLESVEGDMKHLKEYEKKIYNEFIPVLENMKKDLPSSAKLSVKSAAGLDISKWKVQEALRKVKLVIKEFTQGFQVADEMNILIESLQNTINTMIEMYDLIQNYQQEKNLAAYIAKLSDLKNYHLENKVLESAVNAAKIIIRKNLALIQYKKSFQAYKQWVFPFTELLDTLNAPDKIESLANLNSDSTSFILTNCSSTIEQMHQKLNGEKSQLSKNLQIQAKINYDPETLTYRPPIFMWKNETHHAMISDLLNGSEVILRPDARFYPHNAVKINEIQMTFIPRNKSMNETLNSKMRNIDINMVHEGDSHYRCGQKLYLMPHESFSIINARIGQSNTADALQKGDFLISPFATWRVSINMATGARIPPKYLSQFKNNVDLVFEGKASYVRGNYKCNERLSKYYEEYIPML